MEDAGHGTDDSGHDMNASLDRDHLGHDTEASSQDVEAAGHNTEASSKDAGGFRP